MKVGDGGDPSIANVDGGRSKAGGGHDAAASHDKRRSGISQRVCRLTLAALRIKTSGVERSRLEGSLLTAGALLRSPVPMRVR